MVLWSYYYSTMKLNNKYLVIINPTSGPKSFKNISEIIREFLIKAEYNFDIFISEYKNHITEHLISLSPGIYTDMIIWGGDGTFNEVINGLFKRKDNYLPYLGLLPGGSGNSVMHDLQATTLNQALGLITKNKKKMIDVMKIEYSNKINYSINIAGWGMVADVAHLAEKLRWIGPGRYTFASLIYILRTKKREAILTIDNNKSKGNYLFITVNNTIYTGKGMKIAPNAKLDDGLLDINVIKNNISKLQLFKLLPQLFTGEHIESPYVEYHQCKNIKINFSGIQKINIDGEIITGSNIEVSVLKQKLCIYS